MAASAALGSALVDFFSGYDLSRIPFGRRIQSSSCFVSPVELTIRRPSTLTFIFRFSTYNTIPCDRGKMRLRSGCSIRVDRVLIAEEGHQKEELGESFFEAIDALEQMSRDPSDILAEMNSRLSAREMQLVLVYFSQEGRDSWCALEVFQWLKKENRVDKETMELMVSIMCGWIKKLIQGNHNATEVLDLLLDIDCVGLKPNFSMMEKVISLYWGLGMKDMAAMFVEEVLRRGIIHSDNDDVNDGDGHRGGPAGYLAWKMMEDGNYGEAVLLVIHLRESGLRPEIYSYLIAMRALLKELNEVAKAFRKVKSFARSGLVAGLDEENVGLIEKYQSDLLAQGVRLSSWVVQERRCGSLHGLVCEKLLAMYVCVGRGLEAEGLLWELKLMGKRVDRYFYDIVLAICASQGEAGAVARLLAILEAANAVSKKETLSWLVKGYIKGENFEDAAIAITKMLQSGLHPYYLDRVAVLQGLRKRIQQPGKLETYLRLCKYLADAELVGPCLTYMHLRSYKLWIVKTV